MADKTFSWKEFVLADLGAAAIVNVVMKMLGEKGAETLKKSFDEQRGELLAFIMTLKDERASANLLARHGKRQTAIPPYKEGDEVKFVQLLTKLKAALDEPTEKEIREQIFTKLGHMADPQFDITLTFLEHDVLKQWAKKAVHNLKVVYGWSEQRIMASWPEIKKLLQNTPSHIDHGIGWTLGRVNDRLEEVVGVSVPKEFSARRFSMANLVTIFVIAFIVLYLAQWAYSVLWR